MKTAKEIPGIIKCDFENVLVLINNINYNITRGRASFKGTLSKGPKHCANMFSLNKLLSVDITEELENTQTKEFIHIDDNLDLFYDIQDIMVQSGKKYSEAIIKAMLPTNFEFIPNK